MTAAGPPAPRRRLLLPAALALAVAASACSIMENDMDTPPESEYTQAEVYAPAEAAVAELVASLPDFPGFEKRSWAQMPCSHDGVDDPDYTQVEIRYSFSEADSATPLVNERYVELLREQWTSLGYEITRDDAVEAEGGTYRDLMTVTGEGVSLWYSAAFIATLNVGFGGCVPVSEPGEIEYIPPSGGIEPGGPNDGVTRYFPDGVPAAHEAVDPFEAPATYDDQL